MSDTLFPFDGLDFGERGNLSEDGEDSKSGKRRRLSKIIRKVTRGLFPGHDMKCRKCGKWGRYEEFVKCYGRYISLCLECRRQYYQDNKEQYRQRDRQYRQDNKEYIRQYRRQYYQDNKEQYRQYYQDNKEQIRQYIRQWRQDNKEQYRQRDRQWQRENKEKVAARQHRRRARKNEQPDTITASQLIEMREAFGNCCAICDATENLHNDHFFPLDTKHTDMPIGSVFGNFILLCGSCNSSKNNKHPIDWLLSEHPESFDYIMVTLIELGGEVEHLEELYFEITGGTE